MRAFWLKRSGTQKPLTFTGCVGSTITFGAKYLYNMTVLWGAVANAGVVQHGNSKESLVIPIARQKKAKEIVEQN
jgi:hypothetical protein